MAILQQNKNGKLNNSLPSNAPKNTTIQTEEQIDDIFNSFLKESEIDGNEKLRESNNKVKMGNPHIKRRAMVKKVRFEDV